MLMNTYLTLQLSYAACWRSNRHAVWVAYFTWTDHCYSEYNTWKKCPIPMVIIALFFLGVLSNDEETLKFSEHFWTVTSEKWNSDGPGFGVGLLKGDYIDLLLWFEVMGSMSTSTRAVRTPPCHHGWALQGPFLSSTSWHVGLEAWKPGPQCRPVPAGMHGKLCQIPPWSTASTCRSWEQHVGIHGSLLISCAQFVYLKLTLEFIKYLLRYWRR